jgi:hypothetical protein
LLLSRAERCGWVSDLVARALADDVVLVAYVPKQGANGAQGFLPQLALCQVLAEQQAAAGAQHAA